MTDLVHHEGKALPLRRQAERVRLLEEENAQLRQALEARIVIEQAKGAISARTGITPDVAFELMRGLARNQRRNLHEFAAEVVGRGGRLD